MSKLSWQEVLAQTLTRLQKVEHAPRIVVMGIGRELRGDDAVGIFIARGLKSVFGKREALSIIDADAVPENYTGLLREFHPDLVLFIDAAQMNEVPGTILWLPWQETVGLSASTHTLPLHILAMYLNEQLGCEVALLGIQPAQTEVGAKLSPVMRAVAQEIEQAIVELLHDCPEREPR